MPLICVNLIGSIAKYNLGTCDILDKVLDYNEFWSTVWHLQHFNTIHIGYLKGRKIEEELTEGREKFSNCSRNTNLLEYQLKHENIPTTMSC